MRVLLIEDNPADARLMKETLAGARGAAFELEWAKDLAAGLARLAAGGIELVLVDLSLPDSRGLGTFARVQERVPQLPIIVLTGLDDEETAVQAVQQGAQDYLAKGTVTGPLLIRAMRYALERKRAEEQLARYAQQLRATNAEMQEELIMAREIQQALVPQQYPALPRGAGPAEQAVRFHHYYRPTTALGGDFFHVAALADTEAGVFISDVMGHGVRAALVTAILRGLVEELRPAAREPGRFLGEINRELQAVLSHAGTPMFTSAFYLVADVVTGEVRYASAGHPTPIWVRREAGVVEPLPMVAGSIGPALGLFEESAYPASQGRVAAGDLLLLFTDGVYEVTDAGGEEFGSERLLAAVRRRLRLPAPRLFDELLGEALQFSATGEFADDVCLVGLEVLRLAAGSRGQSEQA